MAKSPRRPGRPELYTPELAERVCDLLARGKSLREVEAEKDMPSRDTILTWMWRHPEFPDQYRRAKALGVEALLDEAREIADDGTNDYVETKKGILLDKEAVLRSKLRVDTRIRIAEKLAPKVYGAKLEIEHAGKIELADAVKEARERAASRTES